MSIFKIAEELEKKYEIEALVAEAAPPSIRPGFQSVKLQPGFSPRARPVMAPEKLTILPENKPLIRPVEVAPVRQAPAIVEQAPSRVISVKEMQQRIRKSQKDILKGRDPANRFKDLFQDDSPMVDNKNQPWTASRVRQMRKLMDKQRMRAEQQASMFAAKVFGKFPFTNQQALIGVGVLTAVAFMAFVLLPRGKVKKNKKLETVTELSEESAGAVDQLNEAVEQLSSLNSTLIEYTNNPNVSEQDKKQIQWMSVYLPKLISLLQSVANKQVVLGDSASMSSFANEVQKVDASIDPAVSNIEEISKILVNYDPLAGSICDQCIAALHNISAVIDHGRSLKGASV